MAEPRLFYQDDCNLSLLEGKTIAIIGYGSQGHAHALNLKDSGCNVIIGLYEGSKSWKRAEEQGFKVYVAAEAAKQADIIMILINDELQADMYKKDIEPNPFLLAPFSFWQRKGRKMDFAEATVRVKPLSFGPTFSFWQRKGGWKKGERYGRMGGKESCVFCCEGRIG